MTSGPITSRQIEGEKVEVVTDFLFMDSKITVGGDRSHEIRRWLLLGRKAMTNPDSVVKSRDITLPTKVHIVKAVVFPMVIYWCESWTVKRLRAEELMPSNCGVEKTPESPLDCKEIKPINLKGNQLWILLGKDWCWSASTLVTWCEQLTHWKSPWCWEKLRAEGEEGIRGWDNWLASLMQWTCTWANFRRWWGTGRPGLLQSMGLQRVRHNLATEQQ